MKAVLECPRCGTGKTLNVFKTPNIDQVKLVCDNKDCLEVFTVSVIREALKLSEKTKEKTGED